MFFEAYRPIAISCVGIDVRSMSLEYRSQIEFIFVTMDRKNISVPITYNRQDFSLSSNDLNAVLANQINTDFFTARIDALSLLHRIELAFHFIQFNTESARYICELPTVEVKKFNSLFRAMLSPEGAATNFFNFDEELCIEGFSKSESKHIRNLIYKAADIVMCQAKTLSMKMIRDILLCSNAELQLSFRMMGIEHNEVVPNCTPVSSNISPDGTCSKGSNDDNGEFALSPTPILPPSSPDGRAATSNHSGPQQLIDGHLFFDSQSRSVSPNNGSFYSSNTQLCEKDSRLHAHSQNGL